MVWLFFSSLSGLELYPRSPENRQTKIWHRYVRVCISGHANEAWCLGKAASARARNIVTFDFYLLLDQWTHKTEFCCGCGRMNNDHNYNIGGERLHSLPPVLWLSPSWKARDFGSSITGSNLIRPARVIKFIDYLRCAVDRRTCRDYIVWCVDACKTANRAALLRSRG